MTMSALPRKSAAPGSAAGMAIGPLGPAPAPVTVSASGPSPRLPAPSFGAPPPAAGRESRVGPDSREAWLYVGRLTPEGGRLPMAALIHMEHVEMAGGPGFGRRNSSRGASTLA